MSIWKVLDMKWMTPRSSLEVSDKNQRLNRGTQCVGITMGVKVELRRYLGSYKAKRIDQFKAGSSTVFMVCIYTGECGYTSVII
jgi:hypothetical protein